MTNITSLTSGFQILRNPFRIINSVRCYAEVKKKESQQRTKKEFAVKFEAGVNEVRLMGRLGRNPWLSTVEGKPTLYLLVVLPAFKLQKSGEAKAESNWQLLYTQNPNMIKSLQVFGTKGKKVYLSGQLAHLKNEKCKNTSVNVMITRFICLE